MNPYLITILAVVLIVAAVIDFRINKIPNLLTFPTMILGLAGHSFFNGLEGLLFSLAGLFLGIAIFIIPYLMGGMGAADAKLMGAVGAILGLEGVFMAAIFTAISGGVYALLLLLINAGYARGFFTRHLISLKTLVFTGQFIPIPAADNEKAPKLSYGIAIAAGVLFYISLEVTGSNFLLPG
jgi:prepilin peptidase CpaA